MVKKSQPCKGLEEEHSRQREEDVGMSFTGLRQMAGRRVMGSEVEGPGNEGYGKAK